MPFTVVGVAACGGPTRSAASYCSYFYGEGTSLHNRLIQSSRQTANDPFAELSSAFAALPEVASFLHQLSLRAPEEIAPDVQMLSEAVSKMPEQAGAAVTDPLGALAVGFADSLEYGAAERRVNEYTLKHCGRPPGSNA